MANRDLVGVAVPSTSNLPAVAKPLPCAMQRRIPSAPVVTHRAEPSSQFTHPTLADASPASVAPAEMSLSLSPSPAIGCRAVFATTSSRPPSHQASLFYGGQRSMAQSCSASVLHLSQSTMSTIDADRRPVRGLPACPPRSHHAAARQTLSREPAVPSVVEVPAPPAATHVAEDFPETGSAFFTVNGCTVRQLPRYPIVPASCSSRTLPSSARAAVSLSDPSLSSASGGSGKVYGVSAVTSTADSAATSAASPDKLPADWTGEELFEDGFSEATMSDLWENHPTAGESLFVKTDLVAHVLNRDGAKRTVVPRFV